MILNKEPHIVNRDRLMLTHYLMLKFNNGSILYIFIKSCYKRPSFRSYNKITIIRVKLLEKCLTVLP